MDDNKDCVPLGKQVCVISTWLQVGAGGRSYGKRIRGLDLL